jgi:hypothetical protein
MESPIDMMTQMMTTIASVPRPLLDIVRGTEVRFGRPSIAAALVLWEDESISVGEVEETGRAVVVVEYSPQTRRSMKLVKSIRWRFCFGSFMLSVLLMDLVILELAGCLNS